MPDFIQWLVDPVNWDGSDGIPTRLFEHLQISGSAVLLAMLIGLPIGLWIGHTGRGATAAINIANIGRAIPSYALMGMILPLSLNVNPDVFWLAFVPVFVAMTALAIPPILVGAYAGLREVDRDLIEAARGMGLRERQILFGIEIPLAAAVIVGGIRTSALQVIATATIGAILSGGGLGRYIFDGILNQDYARVVAGAILVAALAIVVDILLAGVQRVMTPRPLRTGVRAPEPPDIPGDPPPTGAGALVRAAGG
jgi:osmoprotectant transport system permease protein